MKVVLVTGASGGLGYPLCETLLEKGYFVILHGFTHMEKLEDLHQRYLNSSLCIEANLKDEEEVLKIKEFLKEKGLSLTGLINNAAIDHVSDVELKNAESFIEVFRLNTIAPFLLMKIFGKEIEMNKGFILNISSDNTIDQFDPRTMEYDVSKAGLNLLTQEFALLYPNACVNAILFGWLDTPMNDIPDDVKKWLVFVPLEKAVDSIIKCIEEKETGKLEVIRS